MVQITPEVSDVLRAAHVEGRKLVLPSQMDRKLYVAVDKVLHNLGGRWDRKTKAHQFDTDPTTRLAEVLGSGVAPVDPRKEEGYFATPDDLADRLVLNLALPLSRLSALGKESRHVRLLEPSAGEGSLVRAARRVLPDDIYVIAVEPNKERAAKISDADEVHNERFEDYATTPSCNEGGVGLVVMNPPFTLPGEPTVWMSHIRLVWEMLVSGGRLVSVVPMGFSFREDKAHREIRAMVERYGGWTDLPDDSFKLSGTCIRTCMLWMDKS